MAQATWEKTRVTEQLRPHQGGRWKFLIGGGLILSAVIYLIVSGTTANARYFITVEDLLANPAYVGQTVRISGAVRGETIEYDSEALTIEFTISNIPSQYDNLAVALHESVMNPDAARVPVIVENQVKPDLLQHEAQAILTGSLDANGVFHATELLLKCPSRFEEAAPGQSFSSDHPEL